MNVFPQFAEREGQGFKQQDADECFQNILQILRPVMNAKDKEGESYNLLHALFNIEMEVKSFFYLDSKTQIILKKNLKLRSNISINFYVWLTIRISP